MLCILLERFKLNMAYIKQVDVVLLGLKMYEYLIVDSREYLNAKNP